MAISLKELSEKITKPGFWSPDFSNKVGINSGYNVTKIGYVLSIAGSATIRELSLYVNNVRISFQVNSGANSYHTNSNIISPVKPGDVITYTNGHNSDNTYFIPAILTIYYIVRYNIYKLVRFLSHLNTKFGGERR